MSTQGERFRVFLAKNFGEAPWFNGYSSARYFLNVASWAVLIFYIRPIDLPIVLHYNVILALISSETGGRCIFARNSELISASKYHFGLFFSIRKKKDWRLIFFF